MTKLSPLITAGAASAVAAFIRSRRRGNDPVHAPGHRHRKFPPNDREPQAPEMKGPQNQPWIRRSHSDSQKRRFRR